MKKFKKVFAVILSLAMVLGMSMTSFAANTGSITVDGLENGATCNYIHVIKPDRQQKTGWAFATDAIYNSFKEIYGEKDAQDIIQEIINDGSNHVNLRSALAKLPTTGTNFNNGNKATGLEEGLYKVNVTAVGYSYNEMAAYVGFDTTEQNPTVVAKKQQEKVTKTVNDDDKIVFIGKDVQYTITTTVPYLDENTAGKDREWKITDTITGAEFKDYVSNGVIKEGLLKVAVSLAGGTAENLNATVKEVQGGYEFVVDLSKFINMTGNINGNANKALTITYKAVITAQNTTNIAKPSYNGTPSFTNPDPVEVTTAQVTITKRDSKTKEPLAGAQFVVQDPNTNKYAVITNGVVTRWANSDVQNKLPSEESGCWTSASGTNGKVTVAGLEKGVEYNFYEVKAPEGYSLIERASVVGGQEVDENAENGWTSTTETINNDDGTTTQKTTWSGKTTMDDTKLSSLPSTGGIGTTIFTIGGCAIMIIAAALFFASRRRVAK